MIKEIEAKRILQPVNWSGWFGVQYNMNIYRGCQHGCIYCDSRSECYGLDNFDDILVKANAIECLQNELKHKRQRKLIGTGAMSDPYIPIEKKYLLMERALKLFADRAFPIHIATKSVLVLRDLEILKSINRVRASVAMTITTPKDELAQIIEPKAPPSSVRFEALKKLSEAGITTGILLMPVLPYITDKSEDIKEIVKRAADAGVSYIYPGFGLTMRDRQRAYLYQQFDYQFSGMTEKYIQRYQNHYECACPNANTLYHKFTKQCVHYQIAYKMPDIINIVRHKPKEEQLNFF